MVPFHTVCDDSREMGPVDHIASPSSPLTGGLSDIVFARGSTGSYYHAPKLAELEAIPFTLFSVSWDLFGPYQDPATVA